MQKLIAVAGLTTATILFGCTVTMGPDNIPIANELTFDLLHPETYGKSIALTQLAEIKYGDESLELLFVTEITPRSLTVVGLVPSGTRLFSVAYNGSSIANDGFDPVLRRIRPDFLLMDLQLSLWPLVQIKEQFRQHSGCTQDTRCTFTESADGRNRTLVQQGNELLSISYLGVPHASNNFNLKNLARGYELNLTFIELQEL